MYGKSHKRLTGGGGWQKSKCSFMKPTWPI